MARQIIVRLVVFLIAWAFYTLISDPASKIDNIEAVFFGIVISVLGPQMFRSKKQVTDINFQTVATLEKVNPASKTPRVFWILWATWAIALVVLSILFWPNWQSDEKWSYILAAAVMVGGCAIQKFLQIKW